jgi:hypothetical protein
MEVTMPYLNLDVDYLSHPKITRLVAQYGPEAALVPIRLWIHAAKYHARDGILRGYTPVEIVTLTQLSIKNDETVPEILETLVRLKLLDKVGTEYKIHDWEEHAGHLQVFKTRAKSAAKARWKRYATSNAKRNAKHATSNAKTEFTNAPNHTLPNHTLPNHTLPNLHNLTKSEEERKELRVAARSKTTRAAAKSAPTWEAYAQAYRVRYGVPPVRNASVNAMLNRLVDKLGMEEAPLVAAFYLTHPGRFYVEKGHPVNLLLQDAEKLRTEWATRRIVTAKQAQQTDAQAERGQIWRDLINEFTAKEGT